MYWIEELPAIGVQRYLSFKNAIRTDRLPLHVAIDTVHNITKRYPGPYTLFASGGIDSQACIYSWIKSNVDFEVVFVRFENDFNQHDFTELETMQKLYGFKLTILDFNVIDFLTTKLKDYVIRYKNISPMLNVHFAMSEMVTEGTIIFSGNYCSPPTHLEYPAEVWMNYLKVTKRNIVPCFFLEDPELATSFYKLHDDIFFQTEDKLKDNKFYDVNGRINWHYEGKCLVYKAAGFPIIPQPYKATGFEKIKDYCDIHFPITTKERLKYSDMPSKRAFEIKFRYPWIKLIPESMYHIKIINQ